MEYSALIFIWAVIVITLFGIDMYFVGIVPLLTFRNGPCIGIIKNYEFKTGSGLITTNCLSPNRTFSRSRILVSGGVLIVLSNETLWIGKTFLTYLGRFNVRNIRHMEIEQRPLTRLHIELSDPEGYVNFYLPKRVASKLLAALLAKKESVPV